MDAEGRNKTVPESEESDPGYVQLVNEPTNALDRTTRKPAESAPTPLPPHNGTRIKVSLSQEQIKSKASSSSEFESVPTTKYAPKIRLQSPIRTSTKSNRSIAFKDTKKTKELASKIICKLCDSPFVDPRVLSCLHCFCLACLNRMTDSEGGDAMGK